MESSSDAATLATRICNCCRVLCCPALRSTQAGDSFDEIKKCSGHLSYLLEQSLLHGLRRICNGEDSEDSNAFSMLMDTMSEIQAPESKKYAELADLAKALATTSQGRVRLFVRHLFNHCLFSSFIVHTNLAINHLT